MTIIVRVLKARHGDCILVSHEGEEGVFNLLIDGGTSTTFRHGNGSATRERFAVRLMISKPKGSASTLPSSPTLMTITSMDSSERLRNQVIWGIWSNPSGLTPRA